jgi:hypothetical protein
MLKHILLGLSLLLFLVACGGGGEGENNSVKTPPASYQTVVLKIALNGSLPANTAIIGTDFTLFLPANVTPAMTGASPADGVVTPSGTFMDGILLPPVYTPATATTTGRIQIALASTAQNGATLVGEIATITLQLAKGAVPTVSSFYVSTDGVIDVIGIPIGTLNAIVTEVTLL